MENITIDLDEYFNQLGEWKKKLTKPKKICNVIVTRSKADDHTLKIGDNFLYMWKINDLKFETLKNVVAIGKNFLGITEIKNGIDFIAPDLLLIDNSFMRMLKIKSGKIEPSMPKLIRITDLFMYNCSVSFAIFFNGSCKLEHIGKYFMYGVNCIVRMTEFFDKIQSIEDDIFDNSTASIYISYHSTSDNFYNREILYKNEKCLLKDVFKPKEGIIGIVTQDGEDYMTIQHNRTPYIRIRPFGC